LYPAHRAELGGDRYDAVDQCLTCVSAVFRNTGCSKEICDAGIFDLNNSNALQSFSPRVTVGNVAASSGFGCPGMTPNKLNRLAS
jgi:hypothetical protein